VRKTGRPKEPERKTMCIHILPETEKAIRNGMSKTNRKINTYGKVIDQKFLTIQAE